MMLNSVLKKSIFFFVYFTVACSHTVLSQPAYKIRGVVIHTLTGEPVAGANLVVLDSPSGTSSNEEGLFELQLGAGVYIIRITSVGFSGQETLLRVPDDSGKILEIELSPGRHEIEEVDVFGRLFIPDRDTSIRRIPVSVLPAITTISAAEMEKQGSVTLVDAMKFVPGAWTETRGRKTKQFFSVRGQKYPYPDYSINGVWQREFEETGYFLSALDIESVEIVRSANALVKGLSGLTGVIDVKTISADQETVSLLAKYGEQNNFVTNLRYGNRINDLSFNSSISFFGTDGPPGRNGKERIGNLHAIMDWRAGKRVGLSAGVTYINGLRQLVRIDDEIGAPNIKNRIEKYDPVRTLLSFLKMHYEGNNGGLTELQVNMSSRDVDFSTYNIPGETQTWHNENDREYGLNVLHSRPLSESNTLRFGALYNHWIAPEGKRFYVGRSCNVHTYSGVIASEQKAGKFLFDAGIRLIGGHIVEWGGFGIEGSASGFQNVAPVEDQAVPVEWQSVLGATFLLSRLASLHYNFSGGTIAPRKGSLLDDGTSPESEGRFSNELGYRYHLSERVELSAASFLTHRRNAIDYSGNTIVAGDDLVMELYENADKRSYGVEGAVKLGLSAVYSHLFANAMIMQGQKEVNGEMEEDIQIPNVIVNGGLLFGHAGFDANLFVHYTGKYANNRFVNPAWIKEYGDFPLGDFLSADLTAGYTVSGKYETRFFLEGKNILNKKYMTVAGYPDPGRIIMAGIKITCHPD